MAYEETGLTEKPVIALIGTGMIASSMAALSAGHGLRFLWGTDLYGLRGGYRKGRNKRGRMHREYADAVPSVFE